MFLLELLQDGANLLRTVAPRPNPALRTQRKLYFQPSSIHSCLFHTNNTFPSVTRFSPQQMERYRLGEVPSYLMFRVEG